MIQRFLLPILALTFLALPGFTTEQPADERAAQTSLPQSNDAMWTTLGAADIRFEDQSGTFIAKIPDDIKKLNGTTVKISGFILPLEADEKFNHFLLSKRTPTCPYCPPGEPDEIVEIFSSQPTDWDDALVTYEGTFELIDNRESGLFFRLNEAAKK